MNYTLMPSLEHRTLITIVVPLFNEDDIRSLIANFFSALPHTDREKKMQDIEDKVMEKVLQLPLPEPFKKEILCIIKPLVFQILKYKHEHSCFGIDLSNELCWTPQGTVDKKKTAELLIKDENIDITARYKLACIYCLEGDIPELWNRIPENHRKHLEDDPRDFIQRELVVHWTYNMKGEVDMFNNRNATIRLLHGCSPYQYAFDYAAVNGNKVATKYFLQKLTSREREESLIRSAMNAASDELCSFCWLPCNHYKDGADVLCFLLSQMDEGQQLEVFKRYSYNVVIRLLDWPFQSLFMEMANRVWDFFSETNYNCLLSKIVLKLNHGYKDCNYQQLFREFWKLSSNAYKRHVLGEIMLGGYLLASLFEAEDEENVRLILKTATVEEKENIIFRRKKDIFKLLIYKHKWDLLEFFVQECISSKQVMIKFKEKLKFCCTREELENELWNKCFYLLDDLIHKDDKKKSMEDEISPAKRLHSAKFEEVTHSIEK